MGKIVLKVGLYAAFVVCLYVSIPHLAWCFHSFEHGNDDTAFVFGVGNITFISTSTSWWNAYLHACSIDVIIALISVTLTNSKRISQKGIGYGFVALLIAVSWFMNWIYDKDHAPDMTIGVWSYSVMWVRLGDIVPIITSALPLFALAFTIMIDKLTGETLTVAELEQQLKDKKALADLKLQYAGAGAGLFTGMIKRRIDAGVDLLKYSRKAVRSGQQTDTGANNGGTSDALQPDQGTDEKQSWFGLKRAKKQTRGGHTPNNDQTSCGHTIDTDQTENGQFGEHDTDSLPTVSGQFTDTDQTENGQGSGQDTDTIQTGDTPLKQPHKPLYITFAEASKLSGYSTDYLSKLVNRGHLATKKNNSKLLLMSKVEAYLIKQGKHLPTLQTDTVLQLVGSE